MLASRSKSQHGTNHTSQEEIYTTNFACIPTNCINPVIPGLMYLGENVLEKYKRIPWSCASVHLTPTLHRLGGFCASIIAGYPFGVPKADPYSGSTEYDAIHEQERKALETYVGHLAGMGFDVWDFPTPWDGFTNDCVKAVWRMSCYTHFPRCSEISDGAYLPPCRSSCEHYLKECSVDCCDEGVQCVFTHTKKMSDGSFVQEHGYPNHNGPSPLCTGELNGGTTRAVSVIIVLFSLLLHVTRQL